MRRWKGGKTRPLKKMKYIETEGEREIDRDRDIEKETELCNMNDVEASA